MENMSNDELRQFVETESGGKQTVLYTSKGQASFFNVIERFNLEDLHPSLGTGPHPAFVVNGVVKDRIYIATYQAVLRDGEAVSLPNQDPATSIDFDQARAACLAAGPGFHLLTNWEWAAIALWCAANSHDVRGNTNCGKSHSHPEEKGIRAARSYITLTGSGPDSWRHNGTPSGIADLVGNVWEWVDGLKLSGGEIIMSMDNALAESEGGWTKTGAVVSGTNGVELGGKIIRRGWSSKVFREVSASNGFEDAKFLKQAALLPVDGLDLSGHCWADNTEDFEALPIRGGSWVGESLAGLGALYLCCGRSASGSYLGFRPAFIE
jgi:formylglycine-generating enzyme